MGAEGFGVDVDTLGRVARTELPAVADALRAPISIFTDHAPTARPVQVGAVRAMELAYGAFTEDIGRRQRTGCERIDLTAEALYDIAAVYRRVDGQG
jgi:hypothetical protein